MIKEHGFTLEAYIISAVQQSKSLLRFLYHTQLEMHTR